jgi:RimJ/RimL family protein N-acetyltransferase
MDHNLWCEHGRVILRPLKEENIEQVRLLRNQPQIRKWFNYSKEISEEEQLKWFNQYLQDPTDYMYVAFLKTNPKQFVGTYASYNLDVNKRTIEVGRLMVDSKNISERGIGRDIVGAAVKLIFENLPVDIITGEVFAENERSIRCTMEGGGLEIIGKKTVNGREVVEMSITRQQYLDRNINSMQID